MCRDCQHWDERAAYSDYVRFAPCRLKPDTNVKDRRVPRGYTEQRYRMSETYECMKFEPK